MQKKAWKTRTHIFHWATKQELYSYFEQKHGLTDDQIDAEVAGALRSFKLRKSTSIRTEELWEKVGRSLARRVGDKAILAELERNQAQGPAHATATKPENPSVRPA